MKFRRIDKPFAADIELPGRATVKQWAALGRQLSPGQRHAIAGYAREECEPHYNGQYQQWRNWHMMPVYLVGQTEPIYCDCEGLL